MKRLQKTTVITAAVGVTLLIGILCAVLLRQHIENRLARFRGSQAIANHRAAPVDLRGHYLTPISRFDQITAFPAFKTVPRGFQVFRNVPLQIEGMICLWGAGNANQLHIYFPEIFPGIPVNQKFETLYIYHAGFFASPNGVPTCAVVFHFEDGSAATNQLFYGTDMLDWTANKNGKIKGPTGSRSTLAWTGGAFTPGQKSPLRFCLTGLKNPAPELEVVSIDLVSCKSQTAPCIMAITAGKADLMK